VRENLDFFAEMHDVSRAEQEARATRLLEFSRLTDYPSRRAEHLSGGMKQKLALACTLIHRPQILFLDEPTTGVDPVSRREFWKILYDLLREGVTLFVATPYMDEAERCAHVAFLSQGRLLAVGTPEELKKRLPYQVVELRARPRKIAREVAYAAAGKEAVQIFGDSLHLRAPDAGPLIERLREELARQGAEIITLRPIAPSMEDVFMEMVRE
jgi:ABC-2 type transport system ATP-binding protein